MAAVYQAADLRSNRIVALKEMGQDGLSPDDLRDALASFAFEADTLSRLRHPNLPRVYERFSIGARHYLAMEFIAGQTLEQRQRAAGGGPLPEAEVLGWARQICDVLTYLHEQRPPIIFRDLKPANVMLTDKGEVKLIDFGIARVFTPGRAHDTQLLGTPGFAPPEQYGKAQTDPRADLYALGCTLYQLLTGYDPGTSPFLLPPMHSRNPAITPHIQRAIERATQHDREARYPSVRAFAQDLLHPVGLIYRSGECARNPSELLALCRRLPAESAEHLAYGRIEGWLRAWHEPDLAAAAQAQARQPDRAAALAAFLREADARQKRQTRAATPRIPGIPWLSRPAPAAPASPSTHVMQAQPGSLYFGRVPQSGREERVLEITGKMGALVQGTITASAPWLVPERDRFSSASTRVRVAVEAWRVSQLGAQQAKLILTAGSQCIEVPVTVEIIPATSAIPATAASSATTARPATAARVKVAPSRAAAAMVAPATQGPIAHGAPAAKTATAQRATRAIPRKYSFPEPPRSRGIQLAMSATLATSLTAGLLAALHPALAQWAPGLPIGGLLFAALLLLTLPLAVVGALAGTGGAGWLGRTRTALAGAALGLVGAFALAGSQLLADRHVLLGHVPGPSGALALLVVLVSLGATLGADPTGSGWMSRVAVRLRRWSPVLIAIGLPVLGAWGGWMLGSLVLWGTLAPLLMIVGAVAGFMVAGQANRIRYARRRRARLAKARP